MLLKHWAAKQGISYRTALRWFHDGKLPVEATQTETGSILVGNILPNAMKKSNGVIVYARVSSHDQTEDLERQATRLQNYCTSSGLKVVKVVTEIGSGLNVARPKLTQVLEINDDIIVEYRDRLARFGVGFIEACLRQAGRQLFVVNETEFKEDLVQDFVDLATYMCSKIYGKRSAANRAKRAIDATKELS